MKTRIDFQIRSDKETRLLSDLNIGVLIRELISHLKQAQLNISEYAFRMEQLEKMITEIEESTGCSLWPADLLEPKSVAEIAQQWKNLRRHFLGRPF